MAVLWTARRLQGAVGTHRRLQRADVEALRARTSRLTRDQWRSLWLGHAVAGRLVADPHGVLQHARRNLQRSSDANIGTAGPWLSQWRDILDGPVEGVLDVLTSRTPRARELRQNSPFAGVLTDEERLDVLAHFTHPQPRAVVGSAASR